MLGFRPAHAKGIVCEGTFTAFLQDPKPTPVSFATESFFANNAFAFVNKDGVKQMDDAAAKAKAPNFLFEQLKTQLAEGSAKFRLVLQLASPGDKTGDSTVVSLAFDPTRLTDGIELGDDPLPALRSRVYALSVAHRAARQVGTREVRPTEGPVHQS